MMKEWIYRFFNLQQEGSTIQTEFLAGLTTYITMAYIIFVNPAILVLSGMDHGAVFVATILSTVTATLIMGLYANVPFAQAPGMGLNAFFAITVVIGMGIPWQQALALVFICGVINFIIVVTNIRKMLIRAIPLSLQYAIGGGIGLFIAYIGFKNAHFLDFVVEGANVVVATVQDGKIIQAVAKDVIPSLAKFSDPMSILAFAGLLVTVVLMLLRVHGAILLGIIITTLLGLMIGVVHWPSLRWQDFLPPSIEPTLFKLDFSGLFAQPGQFFSALTLILAFSLADIFDTIGTFIGAGRKVGILEEEGKGQPQFSRGMKSKMDRALFADGIATSMGALLGTSNVTSYVESAAGISVGGRTGLTSVFTSLFFLLSLFIAPFALMIPAAATAAALIVVGILMMESIARVEWDNFEEAAAAFFTVVMMPFTYSISNGVAAGFIFYVLAKLVRGRGREVHPLMYIVTALFFLNFVIQAIK